MIDHDAGAPPGDWDLRIYGGELESGLRSRRPSRLALISRSLGTGKLVLLSGAMIVLALLFLYFVYLLIASAGLGGLSPGDAGDLLGGTMSIVTTALLIGGGIFALFEYLQREHQHSFVLHADLIERLMGDEDVQARRWVLENLDPVNLDESALLECLDAETIAGRPGTSIAPASWATWTTWRDGVQTKLFEPDDVGRRHVKRILNSYDYLGFIVLKYWELDEDLVGWLSPMVVKVWQRLGPYVERESRWRREPNYYIWARHVGKHMVRWSKEREIPTPIKRSRAL